MRSHHSLPGAPAVLSRLVLLGLAVHCCAGAAPVKVSESTLTLPTYGWAAVRHPYFRGTDKVNIYPYPMMDFLDRQKTNRTYRTVMLENEYLRITFIPELGGRIHQVVDKTTGADMFYVNKVIKPGLIGQCGAWISGGVEWNTGPQGHTVSCLQPVTVTALPPEKDGARSIAIGETERIYGTRWTVVVTLRPGRSFIEERIRIYNPTETVRPYYFWNCTAVPNTPGFRFIYPMTLGCDHAGEKFFQWPVDNGKDLTRGTSYQDASSIFAWHCDQDFFGSYDDGVDRGVVSFANHHQLPGKKAWTWGLGSFGRMHQMDLTDDGSLYNEVQTGPLLTQAQVGRLDPCEAVEWQEWWYPIHGLGGFTFANRDLAVNATRDGGEIKLRLLGTGNWRSLEVSLVDREGRSMARATCRVSPAEPATLVFKSPDGADPRVRILAGKETLAEFSIPLELPLRKPPQPPPKPESASELARSGWDHYLFARLTEAEGAFTKALEKDPASCAARTGLAFLLMNSAPERARAEAAKAVAANPDDGLARLALAVALKDPQPAEALEHAWQASLDPATAVPGRALAAQLLIRQGKIAEAAQAVSEPGPWETDPVCRGRRAFALLEMGEKAAAVSLAEANLATDPIDVFSLSLLWLAGERKKHFEDLVSGKAELVLDLAAQFADLGRNDLVQRVLNDLYLARVRTGRRDPVVWYWAASLRAPGAVAPESAEVAGAFPHLQQTVTAFRKAMAAAPGDGRPALLLGNLLFHLGRHEEGRQLWKQAYELNAEPVLAARSLGMAAKALDNDLPAARDWLEKAHRQDPRDAIVARDLAGVLFGLADRAASDSEKRQLTVQAREVLGAAFDAGKGRSDYVALLARSQNRLGQFAETARMLDQVRVTVWEGAREVHDLFEQAHLELGDQHMKEGRAEAALAEFRRALEYPENLATGKLENKREAHLYFRIGNALKALGRNEEAREAWKRAASEPESKDSEVERARKGAINALKQAQAAKVPPGKTGGATGHAS